MKHNFDIKMLSYFSFFFFPFWGVCTHITYQIKIYLCVCGHPLALSQARAIKLFYFWSSVCEIRN